MQTRCQELLPPVPQSLTPCLPALDLEVAVSALKTPSLQGGFCTADRIVTVSPGYAYEIQTPEGGWGMESLLRSRAYALNGGFKLHDITTTLFFIFVMKKTRLQHYSKRTWRV